MYIRGEKNWTQKLCPLASMAAILEGGSPGGGGVYIFLTVAFVIYMQVFELLSFNINNPFHLAFWLHQNGVNHKLKKISNQWLREFITGCQNIWKHKEDDQMLFFLFTPFSWSHEGNNLIAKSGQAYCSLYIFKI